MPCLRNVAADAGRDATDDFEDVGHSTSAREWLQKYYIGEYAVRSPYVAARAPAWLLCFDYQDSEPLSDRGLSWQGGDPSAEKKAAKNGQAGAPDGGLAKTFKALLPILIILLAVYFKFLA